MVISGIQYSYRYINDTYRPIIPSPSTTASMCTSSLIGHTLQHTLTFLYIQQTDDTGTHKNRPWPWYAQTRKHEGCTVHPCIFNSHRQTILVCLRLLWEIRKVFTCSCAAVWTSSTFMSPSIEVVIFATHYVQGRGVCSVIVQTHTWHGFKGSSLIML